MLTDKMNEALNEQINAELYSAYLYLSMEAYFQSIDLPGAANWMRVQTQEELVHAMKFYDFMNERSGRVLLKPIEAVPTEWDSPLAAFEAAYEHETKVTARIHKLVDVAREEHDHATESFLQWFVNEQVEEESSTDGVVKRLNLAGETGGGLFMVDQELAQRVFTPPPAQGQQQA
ncbi:MAG: ferritin [Planctomycetes bacterium]|nr:ferritin [Planctomycetota bacterium]